MGFSALSARMTMVRTIRLYALPETTKTPGLRPMEPRDVAQTTVLLNKYLNK